MKSRRCRLPPVAVEFFSGSGHLSRALRRHGWFVIEIDIVHGFDILKRGRLAWLRGVLMSGLIDAVHFGTPCSSFSRARDRPNGPPPLRSDSMVLGLPDLRPHDADKVRLGNALASATLSLADVARLHGIPGTVENPHTSRIWLLPSWQRFVQRRCVRTTILDICAFEAPWRKRTRLISWHIDLALIDRRCTSSRGCCGFTGTPHMKLEGVDPATKRFWTKIAEPYPSSLCSLWAKCFCNARASRAVNQLTSVR
jgi:hypothetical protein